MSARMQVCPERIAAIIDGSRGWWCMGNDGKGASLTDLLNELLVAAGEHAAAMHALGVATGAGLNGAYYRARDRVKIASDGLADATVRLGERLHAEESMVIDRFKIEGGKINVTDFANNRGPLVRRVYEIVRNEAERLYHLRVTDVQLPNLDYQPSFRDAQAQAAVVKTQIEQAQGLKLKADIDATTAQTRASGEANAAIQAARGRAESLKLEAEAGAHATLIKGEAEAQAQKLMASALSQNANLVEYQKALRWDGRLPQSIYAGAPMPFMSADQPK